MDPRKERRIFRHMGYTAVDDAYYEGEYAARERPDARNPYPPGRRHDAWNYGYRIADPLGDHHGRNE